MIRSASGEQVLTRQPAACLFCLSVLLSRLGNLWVLSLEKKKLSVPRMFPESEADDRYAFIVCFPSRSSVIAPAPLSSGNYFNLLPSDIFHVIAICHIELCLISSDRACRSKCGCGQFIGIKGVAEFFHASCGHVKDKLGSHSSWLRRCYGVFRFFLRLIHCGGVVQKFKLIRAQLFADSCW